jgi:hypothetical protein
MQQAGQAIRMTRAIIVCEGFFDVITPASSIEHVSTCGTALTDTQAELRVCLASMVMAPVEALAAAEMGAAGQ